MVLSSEMDRAKSGHDQKKFIPQLAIDTEYFQRAFAKFVRCKAKGAVGAVCALLRN
jgi:hypothetical protein